MGPPPLIDERVALSVARLTVPAGRAGRAQVTALRRAVDADLPRVDAAARSWTGLGEHLPPTEVRVVSRIGWVRANLTAMDGAFEPLAEQMRSSRRIASRVLGAQIGALFGLLSRKVIGQFVLPLGGPGRGQLVVVGPNLLDLAEDEGRLGHDIRRTVLLHEITHRLQFDATPWLGQHLRELLGRYLGAARIDPGAMIEIAGRLPDAIAEVRETGALTPLLKSMLTPEQAEVIDEAQGMMSLLEGHGNAAMYDGAADVVGDPGQVRRALERRRGDVTGKILTAVAGLDMKRRQYREGEAFVRAVVDTGGIRALNRAFAAPENLPTPEEIADPDAWMARTGGSG